jgi:hypothetical protein
MDIRAHLISDHHMPADTLDWFQPKEADRLDLHRALHNRPERVQQHTHTSSEWWGEHSDGDGS